MFTIGYGVGNTQSRDENNYNSIAQVLNDSSLQAALSFDPSQVDARVNGVVIDTNAGVTANMRIELVKKAGRKSNGEGPLPTHENQLQPIGLAHETRDVIVQHAEAAKQPFYAALNKAERGTKAAIKAKQREVIGETDPFKKFVGAIIDQLVDTNYVDGVGSLAMPNEVRAELAKLAKEAEDELEVERKKVRDIEAKINAWLKSVIADVSLSVSIDEQRKLVQKALASDPTEAWSFEAEIG